MPTIELSEQADWQLFDTIAQRLEAGLGGQWTAKLDGLDQRYWDLMVEEQVLTLHLEHYLGISVLVPDNAKELTQQVRKLLEP